MSPKKPNAPTLRMYGVDVKAPPSEASKLEKRKSDVPKRMLKPPADVTHPDRSPSQPPAPLPGMSDVTTASALNPFIECELVYSTPEEHTSRVAAVEVWTENHVYAVDWEMTCIEVRSVVSKKIDSRHALLGARLTGGQKGTPADMELTYPLPRPGTEAVFERRQGNNARFIRTSLVTRVILKLHVVAVTREKLNPAWNKITGAWKATPP